MPLLYNDPEHWRKRAEDARALARLMSDPVGKQMMTEIAGSYDRLAGRAVERLTQSNQGLTKPAA
jgi:CHASE3 domain sensor protein